MKKRRTTVSWTEREDALICRLRRRDFEYDDIAARLPERTLIAVKRRVAHLIAEGRIPSLRAAWTRKEDAKLRSLAAKDLSHAEMASHFTNRTPAAVTQRLQQLRLSGRIDGHPVSTTPHQPWTSREDSLLLAMRDRNATLAEIERRLPNRTRKAIEERIKKFLEDGIITPASRAPQSRRAWSKEEDALVAAMREAKKSEGEIAVVLNRTLASIRTRIAQRVRKGELARIRAFNE